MILFFWANRLPVGRLGGVLYAYEWRHPEPFDYKAKGFSCRNHLLLY
jgi:hypothetical protein